MSQTSRNIAVTLECFIEKDGKFLMLHRGAHKKIMPNIWMAPGGHREFNEGLFACARREVMEETNLKIKNIQIKATGNAFVKDTQTEFFFHMLFAEYAGGELRTSKNDGDFAWLSAEEILKLDNLLPEIKEAFPLMLKSTQTISFTAEYAEGNRMIAFQLEDPKS